MLKKFYIFSEDINKKLAEKDRNYSTYKHDTEKNINNMLKIILNNIIFRLV